jgi:hypothetical protein
MTRFSDPFFRAHVYWHLERLYKDLAEANTPLTEKRRTCLAGLLAGFSYEQIAECLANLEPSADTKQNNLYKVKNRMEHTRAVLEKFFLGALDRAEDIPRILEQHGYRQTAWNYLLSEASPSHAITIQHLERGPHITTSQNTAPQSNAPQLPRVTQNALVRFELKPKLPFVVLLSGDTSGKVWSLSPSPISPEAPFRPNSPVHLPKFREQSLWFADIGIETLVLIESNRDLELAQAWKTSGQDLYSLRQESEDLDRLLDLIYDSHQKNLEVQISYLQFEVVPKV